MARELEVRPFESPAEYAAMVDYFVGADAAFLRGMGVDPARLPAREAWLAAVLADSQRPLAERERLYLAWLADGVLCGHSSASHIELGAQAHVHLHLWRPDLRRAGLGSAFFARSIEHYFERLELERVVCEPYAGNPGPNRTLARLGFRLVRTYRTVPTNIALEQDVSRYEITRAEWARAMRRLAP
jgi:RimJ/RimL family protein N-acetyltransferase